MKQADLFQSGRPAEAMDLPTLLNYVSGLAGHSAPQAFSEAFVARELVGEARALRRVKDDEGGFRYIVVNLEALKSWIVEQAMGATPAWPYRAIPERTRLSGPVFWHPDRRKPWERKEEDD